MENKSITIPETYEIVQNEFIEDISSIGYILKHKKSGARIAVISNDDTNKLFCITFFTPPENNKGTPHIIEHTVLQGSLKYPAREPFMQLVKGSLNTFLNAMTYPDKTMYPVSSCNDTDFKNLMDVYLDAVFHPNLYNKREIFMQEGWHFETDENGKILINGVVYSEMKGKSSSPDSNVFDEILTAMFPDNAYGLCSGGDPRSIPDLTYEEYIDFHKKYYHPSNCFIMLYGNVDVCERLEYLDREYLSEYDIKSPIPPIPAQVEFGSGNPRYVTVPYPVGEDEKTENKAYLASAFRVGSVFDEVESAAFDVLGEILVNDPEAYVKRALSDAGIGQEIFGGYLDHIGEPVFAVIAKNTECNKKDEFLRIISETLIHLQKNGINKKTLTSILERTEFKFRESAYGSYPKGLDLFRMMLKGWIYGDNDPFKYIKVLRIIGLLKERVQTGYFEKLLTQIITPSHSAVITLTPEKGLADREEVQLRNKLDLLKESMSESEFDEIINGVKDLHEYQEAPETEEERNCIPVLPRGSISSEPEPISNFEKAIDGVRIVSHDIETNGIVYLRLLFDVSDLDEEMLPYLDLLVELLGNCPTKKYELRELVDEIRTVTGGIDFDLTQFRNYRDPDISIPYLEVSLRTLVDKTEASLELVREILTETDLTNHQRIKEVLGETVSSKSFDVIYNGSEFSAMRALCAFDSASVFNDLTEGIASLQTQSEIYNGFDRSVNIISEKLNNLYESVFEKKRVTVSVASPSGFKDKIDKMIQSVLDQLDRGHKTEERVVLVPRGYRNEAFTCTSPVQYVSLCADLGEIDESFSLITPLIARTITNEILYQEIRVKGGAYGAYCSVIPGTRRIVMNSYRDPGLRGTVEVFSSVYDKLMAAFPDDDKLWQLIIGTFARIDRPLSAYQRMCRSMNFAMTGKEYSDLCKERDAILSVSKKSFEDAVRYLKRIKERNSFCVIGGESAVLSSGFDFSSVNNLFD